MTLNLPKIEEKILKFWKKEKIFKKSLEKTKKGKRFIFYEGPPFANGLPGIHHLLSRSFKDVILRYRTMRGFYVERRAGWDTHGLPVETEAEKKLGIKSKKEIEKIGIDKFINICQKSVFTYKKEWEQFTERIGFWLDFENAYMTCSNDYIESLWWILKRIWEKGLLYQAYKVVPYCPRCGTSLSSHEVAQGYKKVRENSIYVKVPLKSQKNTYLLIWTTTPWTLPGNTAIAANKDFNYLKVKIGSDYLILAEKRLNILEEDYKVVEKLKGKDLLGLEYNSLYNFIKPDKKAHYVAAGDFVSADEGSGLVHMAPAFGIEDMEVAKKNDLPTLITVNREGKFKKEIKDWAGIFVKEADPKIIEDLKKRNLLYKEELCEHEYPFCWRCKNPLLYYVKNSWFIKVTAVKKELIENSREINWRPNYIKEGRFGEWLKEIKDWNLSRERYWGTPLPIWRCQTGKSQNKCNNIKVIGSIEELEKLSGRKIKELHRPFIDKITFKCAECGGKMERVSEVLDCWFDSGSMPFAQNHWPFEKKEKKSPPKIFPADFVSEGIDQTRGWFYTLLAVSTLLGFGPSYKNVICHGLVLDAKGQKMSKSRGNIIAPKEIIDRFGADAARFYFYTVNPEAETKKIDLKNVSNLYRNFFDTLWQSYNFFFVYKDKNFKAENNFQSKNLLDKWIISRLENLNFQTIKSLDNFDIVPAARLFKEFVDDLSNWYIRRSRERFQNPRTAKEAFQTLYRVLSKLAKLIAPFTPFIAEELRQKLGGEEKSVHLADYPQAKEKLIDRELERKMKKARKIAAQTLARRVEAKIKVRQPLSELKFKDKDLKNESQLLDLIKKETNVKKAVFDAKIKKETELNTEISEKLKREGRDREIIRRINQERKNHGFSPKDKIAVSSTLSKISNINFVKKETGADVFETFSEAEVKKRGGREIIIEKEKKDYIVIKKIS